MSEVYDTNYFLDDLQVPENLLPRVQECPQLMPGERREDYFMLFEAMVTELIPDLDLEWLLAIDLAWIFFEIQRYRRWKNAIMLTNRRAALEDALIQTDPVYSTNPEGGLARARIRATVYDLEGDERRNVDVATQLSKGGYDADALNASAFVKGIATLSLVEKLLASARRQLSVTLREALVRREFKVRAEQVNKRLISEHRQLQAQAAVESAAVPVQSE